MVEIGKIEISGITFLEFTLLNDGFIPSGYVEMKCRLSDMDCEGEAFFINITNEFEDKKGDYSPLEMDKEELGIFIDYLKKCHSQMP